MISKNKCDKAILKKSETRPDLIGKTIFTSNISPGKYGLYKDNTYECCGCGAPMVLSHRKETYYFRALKKHFNQNCIYNHGGTISKLSLYDGTEFDYLSIISKNSSSTKLASNTNNVSPKLKEDRDFDDKPNNYEITTKKKIIKDLEKFYTYGQQNDLDAPFCNTTVGSFFITKRTLKANTINDYNGAHLFVGIPFCINNKTYNSIKEYVNTNFSCPHLFTIGSEEHWKTKTNSKRIYLTLMFHNKAEYRLFLDRFESIKKSFSKEKYEVKILVVQDLKVEYQCEEFTILACPITNKRQYKIIKEAKN